MSRRINWDKVRSENLMRRHGSTSINGKITDPPWKKKQRKPRPEFRQTPEDLARLIRDFTCNMLRRIPVNERRDKLEWAYRMVVMDLAIPKREKTVTPIKDEINEANETHSR